jgi:hypothetical protein
LTKGVSLHPSCSPQGAAREPYFFFAAFLTAAFGFAAAFVAGFAAGFFAFFFATIGISVTPWLRVKAHRAPSDRYILVSLRLQRNISRQAK